MATLTALQAASPLDSSNNSYLRFSDDTTETLTRALDNTDANFLTMDSLSHQAEYKLYTAQSNDIYDLSVRIVNGATILAASDSGGTFQDIATGITTTTDTTSSVTAFSYVNTTANKTTWDGASVEVKQTYDKQLGNDNTAIEIDVVEFTGTYTADTLQTMSPGIAQSLTTTYAPASIDRTVPVSFLDASPTVHEPTQQSVLQPGTVVNTITVHEPVQVHHQLVIGGLDVSPTLYEPANIRLIVTASLLDVAPTVHEPTQQSVLQPGTVVNTVVVHEPENISHDIPLLVTPAIVHPLANIHRTLPVPTIDASPTIHLPLRTYTKPIGFPSVLPRPLRPDLVGMPSIASTLVVHEPERLVFQEVFPALIDASATFHDPTLHMAVPVPLLDVSVTVSEPVQIWQRLPLASIDATVTVHEPQVQATATVVVPLVDNTAVVHEPTADYPYTISIDATIAATVVHEPVTLNTIILEAPTIPSGHTVHEPSTLATYDITVELIASTTFVYEPSQSSTAPIFPPLVSETALHGPTLDATVSVVVPLIPATSVVRQIEVKKTAYPIVVPLVASTLQVFEPTFALTNYVVTGLAQSLATAYDLTVTPGAVNVDAGLAQSLATAIDPALTTSADVIPGLAQSPATAHNPTVIPVWYVTIEHIVSTVQFYEPAIHHHINVPFVGPVATIFEPGPYLTVPVDYIPSGSAVYEPTMANVVSLDRILPTTTIHEPSAQKIVSPTALDSLSTVHEFTLSTSIDAPIDFLYNPATLYPPGFEKIATIYPGAMLNTIVHAPEVVPAVWNLVVDAVTAGTDVLEPTLTATASIVPTNITETSVWAPSVQFAVQPGHITSTVAVGEPTATPSATIVLDLIGETAVYGPGVELSGYVAPPTLAAFLIIHDLTVARGQLTIDPELIVNGLTVHEPETYYLVYPPTVTVGTIYEPSAVTVVSPAVIAETTVHELVVFAFTSHTPDHIFNPVSFYEPEMALTVDTAPGLAQSLAAAFDPTVAPQAVTVVTPPVGQLTVHAPELFAEYLVEPFTIEFGWVYEPTADFYATIQLELIDVAVGVYPPATGHSLIVPAVDVAVAPFDLVVYATIDAPVPAIGSTHTVHEPVAYSYNTVTPETIQGTSLHEPVVNQIVYMGTITSVNVVFEPGVIQNVHVGILGPVATVGEPSVVTIVSVPAMSAQTAVYVPNAYDYYPISVPHVPSTSIVPIPAISLVAHITVDPIDNTVSVYVPAVAADGDVLPDYIGSATTIHEPALETLYVVVVTTTIEPLSVHEPALSPIIYIGGIEFIPSTLITHQPVLEISNTIELSTIPVGVVHEPVAYEFNTVTVDAIDASPTVHDVVQVSQALHMPTINVGVVHAFENLFLFVGVPKIGSAWAVHEPAVDFTYYIGVETITPVEIFAPTDISRTVEMPHIVPGKEVYEPYVDFYSTVAPATIADTEYHDPAITTGPVWRPIPHIDSAVTVHEPEAIVNVSVPIVVGSAVVYGPTLTVFAPLEILGFSLAINQEASFTLG